jgi:hypothetical protein
VAPGGTFYVRYFVDLRLIIPQYIEIDDPEEQKDLGGWVDFKRAVWHVSFFKLLTSIESLSRTGHAYPCADGTVWKIYPIILMLVADFEEQ